MASNPNQEEQRKNLLFKCKQMDIKAKQMKEQLEKVTDQIAKGKKPSEMTSGLLVKRFY
jgi:flagellar hook-associated protein FlgK